MLEVKDINLFYGAAQALRGVSISAQPGKVTCVLGRNGVGKTSLLRAMIGQYPIASGSIVFDGVDLTELKPYERARLGIGFVPAWRRPLRRTATAACDRAGTGDAAKAASARRADRGDPALDHQGHQPRDFLPAQPGQHRDRAGRTISRFRL